MSRPSVRSSTTVHPGRSAVEALDTLRARLTHARTQIVDQTAWSDDLTRSVLYVAQDGRGLLQDLDADQLRALKRSTNALREATAAEITRLGKLADASTALAGAIDRDQRAR